MPRVFPIIVCSSVHTFVPSLSLEKICKLNDPIGRGQEAYPFKKKKKHSVRQGQVDISCIWSGLDPFWFAASTPKGKYVSWLAKCLVNRVSAKC